MFRKFLSAVLCACVALPVGAVTDKTSYKNLGQRPQIDWTEEAQEQVRPQIHTCKTLLATPAPKVNTSVGTVLSKSHSPQEFRRALQVAIEQKGREHIEGSHVFITGVDLKDEKAVRESYKKVLREMGFQVGKGKRGIRGGKKAVRVRVMSLPKDKILPLSKNIFRNLWDRIRYLKPSLRRDWQNPTAKEVTGGIVSNIPVEAFNVVWLIKALDPINAAVTVTSHTALIGAFTIWQKALGNWLLRPWVNETRKEKYDRLLKFANFVTLYGKQTFTAIPFIISYNIGGNFTEILDFYNKNGIDATMAAFPEHLAAFTATQSVTLILQTLFYATIINGGIQRWANEVPGHEDSYTARALSPWLKSPYMALDAIALAVAGGVGMGQIYDFGLFSIHLKEWFHLGPMAINTGHFFLMALTATGLPVSYKMRWRNEAGQFRPGLQHTSRVLDLSLKAAELPAWIKGVAHRLREKMKN